MDAMTPVVRVREQMVRPRSLADGELALWPFEKSSREWLVELGLMHREIIDLVIGSRSDRRRLWVWCAGDIANLWATGRGGAWVIRNPGEAGMIWAHRTPDSRTARIGGFRIPNASLTPHQETCAMRLVARWIESELGLEPFLPVPCGDRRAIECAEEASVRYFQRPIDFFLRDEAARPARLEPSVGGRSDQTRSAARSEV